LVATALLAAAFAPNIISSRNRFGEVDVRTSAVKAEVETVKTNEEKWSKELMAAGWTVLPSISWKATCPGLDAIDMNIIAHLSDLLVEKRPICRIHQLPRSLRAIGVKSARSEDISKPWSGGFITRHDAGRRDRAANEPVTPSRG